MDEHGKKMKKARSKAHLLWPNIGQRQVLGLSEESPIGKFLKTIKGKAPKAWGGPVEYRVIDIVIQWDSI